MVLNQGGAHVQNHIGGTDSRSIDGGRAGSTMDCAGYFISQKKT
jgi:hypothetical protein